MKKICEIKKICREYTPEEHEYIFDIVLDFDGVIGQFSTHIATIAEMHRHIYKIVGFEENIEYNVPDEFYGQALWETAKGGNKKYRHSLEIVLNCIK